MPLNSAHLALEFHKDDAHSMKDRREFMAKTTAHHYFHVWNKDRMKKPGNLMVSHEVMQFDAS